VAREHTRYFTILRWTIDDQTPGYLELVYLETALVPPDTACLASSPGSRRRTAVWISRGVIIDLTEGIKTKLHKGRNHLLL
jgi:hypothetical protein